MTKEQQSRYFTSFTDNQRSILLSKGDDYAGADRLNNFKVAGAAAGNSAEINCLNMIATKVARLGQLFRSGEAPKHEAVEDSILDLSTYAFLLACIRREKVIDNLELSQPNSR